MKNFFLMLIILSSMIFICGNIPILAEEEESNLIISVYKNFALVMEKREFELKKGKNELQIENIPVKIDPNSIFLDIIKTDKNKDKKDLSCQILEQNFEYDFSNIDKLISKYLNLGKKLKITLQDGKLLEGKPVHLDEGYLILGELEEDSEPIVINRNFINSIEFPEHPDSLVVKPTLSLKLKVSNKDDYKIALNYKVNDIKWKANYIGIINLKDLEMNLYGYVSITNNSGYAYNNAKIKLFSNNESDSISYLLERKVALKNEENGFSLFDNKVLKISKVFCYNSKIDKNKVKVAISIQNDEQNGLGFFLLNGKIDLYKKDIADSHLWIKEDNMSDVTIGKNVRFLIEDAEDITAERRELEVKNISPDVNEKTFEIELKSNQKEQINIAVIENIDGEWEVIEKTDPYSKKDLYTIEFAALVPPQEKKVIKYKVRIKK